MVAMRNWLKAMAVCGAALLAGAVAGPSAAQQAKTDASTVLTLRGDETPETVRKLVDALSAGGRKVEIRIAGGEAPPQPAAAAGPAAAAAAPNPGAAMQPAEKETPVEVFWGHFVEGVSTGLAALPRLAQLPDAWRQAWAQNRNDTDGFSARWRLILCLALAFGAAGLFRYATQGWFARRLQPDSPVFTSRLIASAWGVLQDLLTLALALLALHAARRVWLPEIDIVVMTLRTIANGVAIGAGHLILGRFLLAPGAPERRLMPLPRADRHFRVIALYGLVSPLLLTMAVTSLHVAGPGSVAGLFSLIGIGLTLFKAWWFIDARHDIEALILGPAEDSGAGRKVLAATAGWLYAASAVTIWVVSNAAAMMEGGARWAEAAALTQLIIVLVPIFTVGATSLLACRQARLAAEGLQTPMRGALGRAAQAAVAGALWTGGFYLLARLWTGLLFAVSSDQLAVLMRQAGGIAILAFGGWVVIVFLHSFFDAYTPKPVVSQPGDEDAVPHDHVPSRLATVLPVLRGVVLGAAIGLTVLVLLSRLGVDIGPLLAGFGILGLAFSFGSQALVRDIVSGFFFMLEDAFRVGEYVDTGRLKGTVEKISLRSMQLRHQSGQVHTVPFGQVQSLTNASRDWATVKFNVRLDHSADIEKARKTIKKIGLALLEDPEFGPHFIGQLKMQGVADITDQAIVIRLKFTGKPNQASMLQREALKRVYRGLIEAEVPFASNAVTVKEGSGKSGAAAIAAIPAPSPLVPAAE